MKVLKYILLAIGLFLLGCVAVALFLFFKWNTVDLPSKEEILKYKPPLVTEVYDRKGKLIGEFFIQRRIYVPIDEIPEKLKLAFLAAEDARFYQHKGIDIAGIIRALIADVKARKFVQGGSTITQQVAKNMFLTPEKTISRKIKEMILAMKLERTLSKDKILELYLNMIYLGHGSYGVAAAAQTYFGKDLKDLTLAECALLAGLPKAPARYSPYLHMDAAYKRRNWVLKRMLEEGFITKKEYRVAISEGIVLARERVRRVDFAPYFNEFLRQKLIEKYGEKEVLTGGLKVYTTLDLEAQRAAQKALLKGLIDLEKRHGLIDKKQPVDYDFAVVKAVNQEKVSAAFNGKTYTFSFDQIQEAGLNPLDLRKGYKLRIWSDNGTLKLWKYPRVNGAVLSIDLNSMGVIAMVGGYDFSISKFNRAYQAKRQPGSSFKPVVYTAAIESGFTPFTIVLDAPVVYPFPKSLVEGENATDKYWVPKNYEGDFLGPIPLWKALALSRNTVSVRLVDTIGINKVVDVARRLGITSPLRRDLSIALGSSEVSLWELLRAYTVFARGGDLCEPIYITKVTDPDGKVLEENDRPLCINVLDKATTDAMLFMLRKVVETGTGRRARSLGRPSAGKTGTTNDYRDAWFFGFTPNIATGVYVGYDDHQSLGEKETGAKAALPIWLDYMKQVTPKYPLRMFLPYTQFLSPEE
ncbi:penicillin-binding protein 1A [Thermosulfidibacter takaii ABI70S6]|uniref:peptidoglycan glycosyltransferase n=1 Tax=Thermosulfidibacter takaii (strain DSM 17441 / JCM 13301 / NBRC 103674 / ABI70S6) TaxID=1298851 RepID=A0A0S3QTS6_THET7|nr:PBP1A family penicillin-binding protein [Thermosulfidibacter takaii]BAT71731.1 penicillin-binding protein 1A [Thermosulfidibacter takaii ABI70S6]